MRLIVLARRGCERSRLHLVVHRSCALQKEGGRERATGGRSRDLSL